MSDIIQENLQKPANLPIHHFDVTSSHEYSRTFIQLSLDVLLVDYLIQQSHNSTVKVKFLAFKKMF